MLAVSVWLMDGQEIANWQAVSTLVELVILLE